MTSTNNCPSSCFPDQPPRLWSSSMHCLEPWLLDYEANYPHYCPDQPEVKYPIFTSQVLHHLFYLLTISCPGLAVDSVQDLGSVLCYNQPSSGLIHSTCTPYSSNNTRVTSGRRPFASSDPIQRREVFLIALAFSCSVLSLPMIRGAIPHSLPNFLT